MRSIPIFIRSFVFAILCLAVTCVSRAQSDRGTIAGTIEDSSGGVVTDAQINVKGADTSSEYNAVSGPTGGFRIPEVKIGIYTVTVTAGGFKTETKTGVQVQVNTVSTLDFSLTVGDVKDTLTVVADAPSVQAESSDIGTVVSTRQIEDLPLALNATGQSHLRSVESFVFLTPGTAGPGTNSNSGIFESKIAGGQNLGTEVLLDGASISHAELGPTFDENAPSVEAISEFKVTTSTLPAQFGRTSGGIESFSTKSGTNAFHGSAFDILHNDKLNANSWFNNHVGAAKDRDHQNDFGGSLGGPAWIPKVYNGRDKTFFFFSWEQYRNNLGSTGRTTLPTDAERTGDFSALLGPVLMSNGSPVINPCDGTQVHLGQIFDPSTTQTVGGVQCRTAFPGNKITTPLSAVAQKMLSFLNVHPDPNAADPLRNNFIFQSNNPQRDTTMSFRIDQNLGINDKLFFSYSSRDQEQLNGARSIPPPLDPNFFKSRFSHYVRLGWDRTISPTLVNNLKIGYNRLHDPSTAQSINGSDWPAVLGIPNATGPVFPPLTFNANPNVNIGYQQLSGGNDDLAVPNTLIVGDSVSWAKGRHTIRMGFEWRHSQFSRYNNLNTSPNYTFSYFQTAYTPSDQNTGDPFASFLLGLPQQETARFSLHAPRWIQNYYAGFIQDDFKFRKNLTLNLGLRYEVDTPRHEAKGIQSVLDLTVPNPGAGGTPGALIYGSNATGAKTYYKDIGPRIGFAYAPDRLFGREALRNTVIRGGYGIYYAALFYTDFGDSMHDGTSTNPTFTSANNFSPVNVGGLGSLDAGFPAFTPPSNAKDPSLLNGNFAGAPSFAGPSNGRPGMVQNWSFEIQHQLAPDLIFTVGYIGNHATHLNSNLQQLNAIDPKYLPLGTKLLDHVHSPAGQATLASLGITSVPTWFDSLWGPGGQDLVGQLLLPFPQFLSGEQGGTGITTNCCLENLGQSTYNALEAKLERRFRNGLNLLASYTFSKTLTDADSAYAGLTAFGSSNTFLAQNPRDLKAEKALSYQDVPHSFVLSYIYELPVGKGKKFLNKGGVSDKILGGWQIGGVHRYQKGVPFIPFALGSTNPFGSANPRLSLVPGQPLLAPNHSSYNPLLGGSGCTSHNDGTFTANGTNNFFNCAAFFDPNASGVVATNGYSFGDLPKAFGNVRSPGYMNEDFSIIKRVTLYEAHVLSFKADLTNAFNRHTFARGDGCVTCDTFGQPGSQFGGGPNIINGTKQVQITLRYEF
ncbi:MAG TPA: TonB-dependent receptor [Candidatus Dormibacteraeota bacterium]|nr:TonB-dependent receptor [Candidatus Dormibacteraeota bacterium]